MPVGVPTQRLPSRSYSAATTRFPLMPAERENGMVSALGGTASAFPASAAEGREPQTDEPARRADGHRGMVAGPGQGVDAGIGVSERCGMAAGLRGRRPRGTRRTTGTRPRPSRPAPPPACPPRHRGGRPRSTRASRSAPPLSGGRRSRLPPRPRPTRSRPRGPARCSLPDTRRRCPSPPTARRRAGRAHATSRPTWCRPSPARSRSRRRPAGRPWCRR